MRSIRVPAGDVLLVAATTLAIFGLWSAVDGGYAVTLWYPAALLLLVLAVFLEWAFDTYPLPRGMQVALAALAGLTVWSYLSIIWADDRGIALTGANRTLVYLLLFFVVVRRVWTPNTAVAYVLAWASIVVVIGVADLARSSGSSHILFSAFTAGRFTRPIEYANANAALFVLAAWPLVWVAQAAAAPVVARAVALGGAGAAIDLALLAQSRGAALALATTIALVLILLPNRLRMGITIAVLVAAVAAVHAPLLELYQHLNSNHRPLAALRAAEWAVAVSVVVLVAAGGVIAWIDRRLHASSTRGQKLAGRVGAVAAAVVLAGLAVAGVARYGNPLSVAQHAWHAFKYPAQTSSTSSHFLTSAGNHRYDFWRVAAGQFRASPILGAGVDNFAADYVLHRRSSEEPLYPHSLEARLLGGTGIVGFLLFAVFAVMVVQRCFAATRASPDVGIAGAIAGTMLLYWLIHGSVDWLWEFPAVTGPVIAAAAWASSSSLGVSPVPTRRPRAYVRIALVPAALVAALALAPAWLAARDTSLAVARWHERPALAYTLLRRASRLNPLSDEPYLVAGTIAVRRHEWATAKGFFMSALNRNREGWYAYLEVGLADAKLGHRKAALEALRSAGRLDPKEPLVKNVETAVLHGQPLSVDALDRTLAARATIRPR